MTFEIQQVTPGESLVSFQPSKYQIAGIRIDNPSGAWYRVLNNGRMIPPWTLGTQILCIPNLTSLTVEFLPVFAGQPSKLVGNKLSILTTDEPLPDAAPIGISNAIPYAQTFLFSLENVSTAGNTCFWSLWPSQDNIRLRLSHLSIYIRNLPVAPVRLEMDLMSITSDANAAIATIPLTSRDGDPAQTANIIARGPSQLATDPSYGVKLDSYLLDCGTARPQGPWVWDYDLSSPDMPPSSFSPSARLGLALRLNLVAATGGWDIVGVVTEEILQ